MRRELQATGCARGLVVGLVGLLHLSGCSTMLERPLALRASGLGPTDALAETLAGDGAESAGTQTVPGPGPTPGVVECTTPKECALAAVYDALASKCSIDFENYTKWEHDLEVSPKGDFQVNGYTASCCDGVSIWVHTELSAYGNIDPNEPKFPGLPSCPDSTLRSVWADGAAFDCSAPYAKKLNTLWVKLYEPDTGLIGERAFSFWTRWGSGFGCTTKDNWIAKCCPNPKPEK